MKAAEKQGKATIGMAKKHGAGFIWGHLKWLAQADRFCPNASLSAERRPTTLALKSYLLSYWLDLTTERCLAPQVAAAKVAEKQGKAMMGMAKKYGAGFIWGQLNGWYKQTVFDPTASLSAERRGTISMPDIESCYGNARNRYSMKVIAVFGSAVRLELASCWCSQMSTIADLKIGTCVMAFKREWGLSHACLASRAVYELTGSWRLDSALNLIPFWTSVEAVAC